MGKHVVITDSHHSFATEQAAEHGLESGEDYVRSLIDREQAKQRLRDALLEGKNSPLGTPVDEAYFKRLERRIESNVASVHEARRTANCGRP